MNLIKRKLEIVKGDCERSLLYTLKQLKGMPEGKLIMRRKNNRDYYAVLAGGRERGINKDPTTLELLKRKEILLKQSEIYKNMISVIGGALEKLTDDFFKDEAWESEYYHTNPFKPEHLRYVTNSGVKVRSKSEKIIADKLSEYGIVYRYEAFIDVNGKGLYPDFTIKKSDGSIAIWEHFGLMNDREYFEKAIMKIHQYREVGFVQHKNLICTYEEDLQEISRIIEGFLL